MLVNGVHEETLSPLFQQAWEHVVVNSGAHSLMR